MGCDRRSGACKASRIRGTATDEIRLPRDNTGKQPIVRDLKKAIRGRSYDEDARDDPYNRARLAHVPIEYARPLLDPEYPPGSGSIAARSGGGPCSLSA